MNGAVPINDGTVAVLAYAVGEERFTDVNNNGLADGGACTAIPWLTGVGQAQQCGEFIDTPDSYRDDNFNGVHDANGPFYNLTGLPSYTGFDSLYEGALQPAASTNPRSKYIFFNSYLIMSRSTPAIVSLSDTNVPLLSVSTASVPVILTVADSHGNPMPSGTTITPTVNAGCTACIKISPSTAIKVPTTNATTQYPLLLSNS